MDFGSTKPSVDDVTRPIKIAFLPYNASMWDSLASIWAAAVNDERCEVRVVALPYQKKGIGSVAGFNRESFPAEVDARTWDFEDLKEFGPDLIYVHNPFDDGNYVTEISPEFHSDNLATLGARIAYVPYFLYAGNWEPQHWALPAYQNFDFLILANERSAEPVEAAERTQLITLGSPKVDAYVTRESARPRPVDGSRRLKIFVNTSIGPTLAGGAETLSRVIDVLEEATRRGDMEVVWRPHPLLESSVRSMRPELIGVYNKIVEALELSPLGSIDASPDLSFVMDECDAYMGDMSSSVVHLWSLTGKPLFIFDNEHRPALTRETRDLPMFYDCAIDDGIAWLRDARLGLLASMDVETGYTTVRTALGGRTHTIREHEAIAKVGDAVVCLPHHGASAVIYDTASGEVSRVPTGDADERFQRAGVWDDKVIMVSQSLDLRFFDPRTGSIDEWPDPLAGFGLPPAVQERLAVGGAIELVGDELYVAASTDNAVFVFNLAERSVWAETVGETDGGWSALKVLGDEVWLAPSSEAFVVAWNPQSNEVRTFDQFPEGFIAGDEPFAAFARAEDGLYLLPSTANWMLFIDPATGAIERFDAGPSSDARARLRPAFAGEPRGFTAVTQVTDSSFLAQSSYDLSVLRVFSRGDFYRFIPRYATPPTLDSTPVEDAFAPVSVFVPWACLEDPNDVTVARMLEYLASGQHDPARQLAVYDREVGFTDGRIGERVHQRVMESVAAAVAH